MITAEHRQHYTTTKDVRTASGRPSVDCGDEIAIALRGKSDGQLAELAEKNGLLDRWSNNWKDLSIGHRRMCLGNALRQKLQKGEKFTQ